MLIEAGPVFVPQTVTVASRLLGILPAALAVQFVLDGIALVLL